MKQVTGLRGEERVKYVKQQNPSEHFPWTKNILYDRPVSV